MRKINETNWLTNNIVPIVFALLTWAVSFGAWKADIDYLKKGQDELRADLRDWKKQYEARLGELEIFKGKVGLKLDIK